MPWKTYPRAPGSEAIHSCIVCNSKVEVTQEENGGQIISHNEILLQQWKEIATCNNMHES